MRPEPYTAEEGHRVVYDNGYDGPVGWAVLMRALMLCWHKLSSGSSPT